MSWLLVGLAGRLKNEKITFKTTGYENELI
jgi:hypothetical protein